MSQEQEVDPEVTIYRNWQTQTWAYREMGAHSPKIPWSSDADAQTVVSYLKAKANGHLRVKVDLR